MADEITETIAQAIADNAPRYQMSGPTAYAPDRTGGGPTPSGWNLAEGIVSALAEAGYEIIPAVELKTLRDDRNDHMRQMFRRTGERDAALDGIRQAREGTDG